MRTTTLLLAAMTLGACGLESAKPPLEETFGQARAVIDEAARDAIGPYPVLSAGPPTADPCYAPYEGRTDDWKLTYELYVEYETEADVQELLDGVARSWRARGLEVNRFETDLVVFPNGTEYRLDFVPLEHARRLGLKAVVSCLPPATQDLPRTIPDLREDPRDLRGPAARPGATTADVVDWIGDLMEATADAVAGTKPERVPPPEPATCFGYSPELFSESVDRAVAVDDAGAVLDEVATSWREAGLDVVESEAGGAPTVIATSGDLALRARPDDTDAGTLLLHGTTPCLPQG